MEINVPPEARERFLKESSERAVDFWPFRSRPCCQIGEELLFQFDGRPSARAVVSGIEPPGIALWDDSGKFINHWKVFWHQRTLRILDQDSSRLTIPLGTEVRQSKPQRVVAVTELREFVFCPRSWKLRRQGVKVPPETLLRKAERIEEGNRFHREDARESYQASYQASRQPQRRGWLTAVGVALMILGVLLCLRSISF